MDSEEGSASNEMQEYFNTVGIKPFYTLGHVPMAERQIRTVKDLIYRRIENIDKIGSMLFSKSCKPTITK